MNKEVVILANSVKHHNHCVAGKCTSTRQWVRPVSTAAGGALTNAQSTYDNVHGSWIAKPMQKIRMRFIRPVPIINQPENYLISGDRWSQHYKINAGDLNGYLDSPDSLWGEGDCVVFDSIASGDVVIEQSLYLVLVDNLRVYKNNLDKRRASFSYRGIGYDLAVTDPNFDVMLADGAECSGIICVSLGENFKGQCYKLVATIF